MQARSWKQQRQESSEGNGRHAVVIGGSIGGMFAARALADHFDQVTVVERDVLPEGSENRLGVPQARHLHFLLKRGLMAAEEFFPGIVADLQQQGGHLLDQGSDFRILYRSGWSPRKALGLEFCTFTRPLFEGTVRRHLMKHPKVVLRQGVEVAGLELDASRTQIAGVRLRPRHRDPGVAVEEERVEAELVVDASGRGSRAPEWLEAVGYEKPEETVVDAFWGYATRIYEPVEEYKKEWKVLFLINRPPYQPRAGIIQPIEGNRWIG